MSDSPQKLEQAKEIEFQKPQKSLFNKLGFTHPWLEYRSEFSKSSRPFIDTLIIDTAKSFAITYGLGATFAALKALIAIKRTIKNPSTFFNDLITSGKLRAGAFTVTLTFLTKFTI